VAGQAGRAVAAGPTRRLALAAVTATGLLGLAGGLTGCKGIAALGKVPDTGPDVLTLEHAIAAEEAMIALYGSAMRQLSDGGGTGGTSGASGTGARADKVVAVIQAEHQAHLRQLLAKLVLPPRLAGSKIPAARGLPSLPASRSGVLAALAAQERAATTRLTTQLLSVPAPLAVLMASISASEAAHVVFLRRAGDA
jgi:hypothetical protein